MKRILDIVLLIAFILGAAACGGSSSGSGTSATRSPTVAAAGSAEAKAQITRDYVLFFGNKIGPSAALDTARPPLQTRRPA
jgi:hypothetical protein